MFDVFDKPTWNDRESLFVHKPEVSGIMDGTSTIYQYGYPDTNYPILRMPFDLYDQDGDVLPHGMYMIALDFDRKYLLFLQSNEIKARVPVAGLSEEMREDSDFKKREELATKYQKYMNRGHQRKAKKFKHELEIYDKRVRTKLSATITLKEDEGIYILNYETAFQKAFAIIPKF
ncbi:MAG: hypothetical protein K6C94_08370 [Candidatus Gastranaerophilales bacterium]|nr:hypothetical protein [Candidatus Gastranaerophilales bacterium]